MTYKGVEIKGNPSLAMIQEVITVKKLLCKSGQLYFYWNRRNWIKKDGEKISTLEEACEIYNSIVLNGAKKKVKFEHLNSGKLDTKKVKSQQKKDKKKEFTSYDSQLTDKKWKAFRKFVLSVRGERCEKCGSKKFLQIHHLKYKKGCMAWEYTCNDVIVVCGKCHQRIHGLL